MAETPQIDHLPEDESRALPVKPLKLETPVIQSQDLEHQPREQVRTPGKAARTPPPMDDQDKRDVAKEDEEALQAMEELDKQYRKQVPG